MNSGSKLHLHGSSPHSTFDCARWMMNWVVSMKRFAQSLRQLSSLEDRYRPGFPTHFSQHLSVMVPIVCCICIARSPSQPLIAPVQADCTMHPITSQRFPLGICNYGLGAVACNKDSKSSIMPTCCWACCIIMNSCSSFEISWSPPLAIAALFQAVLLLEEFLSRKRDMRRKLMHECPSEWHSVIHTWCNEHSKVAICCPCLYNNLQSFKHEKLRNALQAAENIFCCVRAHFAWNP